MHPFTGLATRTDGAVMACCRSQPIGSIKDQSLQEIWNGETLKRMRKQLLNNERPKECIQCFSMEDQGVESLRLRHIKGQIPESRINLYPNALDNLNEDYSMPFEIPTMEIKLNNLCNLKCRMCHPLDSTSWNDWDEVEDFYIKENNYMVDLIHKLNLKQKPYIDYFDNNSNWWDSFEKLLPYFRRVEFAGGEPLIDPQHYKILDMLSTYGKNIEIKYATNATKTGLGKKGNIFDYWPKFKSVSLNVSIDGIKEVYEYIRGNGDWQHIVENIEIFKTFPNVNRIVGLVAVQATNITRMHNIIKTFLDDLEIIWWPNMVNYPMLLSAQVLPNSLKKLTEEKLEQEKENIKKYRLVKKNPSLENITIDQIDNVINYLRGHDQSDKWTDCLEFNYSLDKSRRQNLLEILPEFKNYV